MATISQPFNTDSSNQTNNTSGGANNNGNSNQQQQPTQITGAGGSAAGGGTRPGGLNANGGTSNNSAATSSGAFPNLQKYITANSGFNQQGGGLAGEVVGNLNNQGQQVQSNTQSAVNAFGNQVTSANQNIANAFQGAQATLANPYAAVSGTSAAPAQSANAMSSGPVGGTSLSNSAPGTFGGILPANQNTQSTPLINSSPVSAIGSSNGSLQGASLTNSTTPSPAAQPTQNVIGQFQQALQGQYTGPSSLSNLTGNQNYGSLQQQANNYTNQAQQAQTENGRFNLLSSMFGKQGYNTGQQTLDNAIMQSSPGQMQQLTGAMGQANTVNQGLTNAYNQSVAQGTGAQANAANVGQQTQAALNQAIGTQNSTVQSELANAEAAEAAQYAAANTALGTGTISQAQANELGLNALQGQSLYGVNPNSYLNQVALNQNNAATQNDYNQFQSLQKLVGNQTQDLTGNNNQILGQFASSAQPSQLYNGSNYINTNGLLAQVAAQQAAYNAAASPYASTLASLGGNTTLNNTGGALMGNASFANGQTANEALGVSTNPLTQNLNAIMGNVNQNFAGNLGASSGTGYNATTGPGNLYGANGTAAQEMAYANKYGEGPEQQYFGALASLMGLQNQYNTSQQFQIAPPPVGT